MIGLEAVYVLAGLMFLAFSALQAQDRSWSSAAFWGCFAMLMLVGSWLPHLASGILVLLLALLAMLGLNPKPPAVPDDAARRSSAASVGNRLFLPALSIPFVTLIGTFLLPALKVGGVYAFDPKQATLISLAIGAIVGLLLAMWMLHSRPSTPLAEGRRLIDAIGWAAVLPQALASLGGIFAAAGVGKVVASLAVEHIPMSEPIAAVAVYTSGMALFTVAMGNAFAAFPVMTAGIGLPIIIGKFHGDPVIMSAVGMLSGFCGTLVTPMAANFNIVPAAVLELQDRNGVIRAQALTALLLLLANTAVMALFVYRR